MPNLKPILIHCLIQTLCYYNDEPTSETKPYPKTLKNPQLAQNQILVGSQSESSTKNAETSSANQNRVSQCRKNPNAIGSAGGPFSAVGSCRAVWLVIACLNA